MTPHRSRRWLAVPAAAVLVFGLLPGGLMNWCSQAVVAALAG